MKSRQPKIKFECNQYFLKFLKSAHKYMYLYILQKIWEFVDDLMEMILDDNKIKEVKIYQI